MGYYKVHTAKNGKVYFNLHAGNNQVIMSSQMYASKDGCMNGIESCQKNSGDESNFEKKEAKNGQHTFNLKAGNGQVIGSSEMYTTTSSRDNGIASVQKNGSSTDVRDES